MKASEFRIGNIIVVDAFKPVTKEYATIYKIEQDEGIGSRDPRGSTFITNAGLALKDYGVAITEEWLLKLGFEEEYRSEFTIKFTHADINEIGYDWNKTFNWRFRFYGNHLECKYVHQLQNLYFAITGEELIFKKGE